MDYSAFYSCDKLDPTIIHTAGGLAVHQFANIVPLSENSIMQLAADISHKGLMVPITLHDNLIIDGRRRAIACESLGITPAVHDIFNQEKPLTEFEIYETVLSLNNRRNINKAQQAMACALMIERHYHTIAGFGYATDYAKSVWNVGAGTLSKAKRLLVYSRAEAIQIFKEGYIKNNGTIKTLSRRYAELQEAGFGSKHKSSAPASKESIAKAYKIMEDSLVKMPSDLTNNRIRSIIEDSAKKTFPKEAV